MLMKDWIPHMFYYIMKWGEMLRIQNMLEEDIIREGKSA